MVDMLRVGVITSTHGLNGEVKVFPTTDDPARFKKLKTVYLEKGKERICREVESVRFFKQMVIVKFKGLDKIEDVQQLRQVSLLVTRDQAVPLEEGEYFIADLLDLEVRTEEGEVLGRMKDVLQTGANDVYVVETKDGGELLIPAIDECRRSVDLEAGVMVVHLLKGLRE